VLRLGRMVRCDPIRVRGYAPSIDLNRSQPHPLPPNSGRPPELGGRGCAPPPVRILDFFKQPRTIGWAVIASQRVARYARSTRATGPGCSWGPIRSSAMTVEARIALRFVQATLACRLRLPGAHSWHPFRTLSNLQGSSRRQCQRRAGQVYGNARRREDRPPSNPTSD